MIAEIVGVIAEIVGVIAGIVGVVAGIVEVVAGIVEVDLAFLPKVLPVLVASRQVDFEVRLAVEAGSVVGMDQAAAVDWVAAE